MALIVFLRGVNVGGNKTFRPSVLARELSRYEVVNVGAAGSFVVWKPPSPSEFCAILREKLPFHSESFVFEASEFLRVTQENPFGCKPCAPEITRFVMFLQKANAKRVSMPIVFPEDGDWLVRLITAKHRFVFGEYRRHMKTIGYLGRIDKLFAVPTTTRNWNTVVKVTRMIEKGRPAGG